MFLMLVSNYSFSQVQKEIDKIITNRQKCFDDITNRMVFCAQVYYNDIDELLNIEYKKIRIVLNETEKLKLKQEQLAWLKLRDKNYLKIHKEVKKDLEGDDVSEDFRMICYDKEALFVQKRILELEKLYLKK